MRKHIHPDQRTVLAGCPICTIVPSHMLRHLARHGPEHLRERMLQTLQYSERLRGQRSPCLRLAESKTLPSGVVGLYYTVHCA